MTRTATLLLAFVLLCLTVAATAQDAPPAPAPVPPGARPAGGSGPAPAPPAPAPVPPDEGAKMELLLQLLTNPDIDPAQLLPLLMMMEGGNVDDDALGFIMLMKGMSGGGASGPVLVRDGDVMFVVQGGVLQKVGTATMEVQGRLNYRQAGRMGPEELREMLAPVLGDKKMDEGQEMFLQLMLDPDADTGKMLPLLLMMAKGGGRMGGDAMGFMLFSKAFSGQGGEKPVCLREGDTMFILDEGILYKINVATMKLTGRLDCRKGAGEGQQEKLMQILGPMFGQAREKALQTACASNLKQLGLAAMMYIHDHDETLPDVTWAEDLFPYTKNRQIYTCPKRPDLPVGYAINAAVVGVAMADIENPAQTVLFFETSIEDENPVGTSEDIPPEGVHNGGINVGFVDSHVKWMRVEDARRLLEEPQ